MTTASTPLDRVDRRIPNLLVAAATVLGATVRVRQLTPEPPSVAGGDR